jgi:hypothetical protein
MYLFYLSYLESFFVVALSGGYDRGECLRSVEKYQPASDTWNSLPDMLCARARFGAAALEGKLYVVGGSDGWRDLDSVHCLDFETGRWKAIAPLEAARSSVCE